MNTVSMRSIIDELFEIISWEEDRISTSSLDLIADLHKRYEELGTVDVYSGFDNYNFND